MEKRGNGKVWIECWSLKLAVIKMLVTWLPETVEIQVFICCCCFQPTTQSIFLRPVFRLVVVNTARVRLLVIPSAVNLRYQCFWGL